MSEPFWLSKLTPSELKLLHDLADVIRATGLKGNRASTIVADLINREIERRGNVENDDNMLPESSAPGNVVENLGPLGPFSNERIAQELTGLEPPASGRSS
jgi:hypothetical protein